MFRGFLLCLIAGGSIAIGAAGVANAESFTTRIEPRPFYGAVVTLEEGVRVIRPLPPVRQVIINPNNTPLSLGFNDTRVYEQSSNYNYNFDGGAAAGYNGSTHLQRTLLRQWPRLPKISGPVPPFSRLSSRPRRIFISLIASLRAGA